MAGDTYASDRDADARPVHVIVNPSAGGGRARRRAAALQRALVRADLPHTVHTTTARGDAWTFANEATANAATVIAVGGDGTVHEVVNGLTASQTNDTRASRLAVLQAGSGDDFARACGFARDADGLVAALRHGYCRTIDCGEAALALADGSVRVERFVNDADVGLIADIVQHAAGIPLRGRLRYLAATLRAVLHNRPTHVELRSTDAAEPLPGTPTALLFASFCNVPAIGGGLRMTPTARIDDGWLDVLTVSMTSRRGTLALLGKLLRGTHLADRRVTTAQLAGCKLRCAAPTACSMDGDLIATDVRELEVRILPRALTLCGVTPPRDARPCDSAAS